MLHHLANGVVFGNPDWANQLAIHESREMANLGQNIKKLARFLLG
jgi:hypothetical protein